MRRAARYCGHSPAQQGSRHQHPRTIMPNAYGRRKASQNIRHLFPGTPLGPFDQVVERGQPAQRGQHGAARPHLHAGGVQRPARLLEYTALVWCRAPQVLIAGRKTEGRRKEERAGGGSGGSEAARQQARAAAPQSSRRGSSNGGGSAGTHVWVGTKPVPHRPCRRSRHAQTSCQSVLCAPPAKPCTIQPDATCWAPHRPHHDPRPFTQLGTVGPENYTAHMQPCA